ncbi:MAG TPA: helix-turn-helix transcriptional regulator [Solirubrobacteraceae bacterium]
MTEPSTSPARLALASVIRAAREQAGYTPASFAAHAGFDLSTYAAIERGEFDLPLDTIVQVTTGLGLSAAELVNRAKL